MTYYVFSGTLNPTHFTSPPTSGIDFSETITNLGKSWQVGLPVEYWLSVDTFGMNSKCPWPVGRAHGEQWFSQKYSLRRQRAISPTSGRPNFTKFAQKTCFREVCWGFGKHLWKFARKGSFFPNKPPFWLDRSQQFPTSGRDFSETITNPGCGMLTFHWHRRNELKVIHLACSLHTWRAFFSPKILFYGVHERRLHGMLHNAELGKT